MEKKIKYNFELKLKFFNSHEVMPPSKFSPKMDNWGGHESKEYGIYNIFILKLIKTGFINTKIS